MLVYEGWGSLEALTVWTDGAAVGVDGGSPDGACRLRLGAIFLCAVLFGCFFAHPCSHAPVANRLSGSLPPKAGML